MSHHGDNIIAIIEDVIRAEGFDAIETYMGLSFDITDHFDIDDYSKEIVEIVREAGIGGDSEDSDDLTALTQHVTDLREIVRRQGLRINQLVEGLAGACMAAGVITIGANINDVTLDFVDL